MNAPEEITPEYAERLLGVLGMMTELDRDRLAFLVGHMAAKDLDLAIEALGALMATELPRADALAARSRASASGTGRARDWIAPDISSDE
jgi:hypothetical protein